MKVVKFCELGLKESRRSYRFAYLLTWCVTTSLRKVRDGHRGPPMTSCYCSVLPEYFEGDISQQPTNKGCCLHSHWSIFNLYHSENKFSFIQYLRCSGKYRIKSSYRRSKTISHLHSSYLLPSIKWVCKFN